MAKSKNKKSEEEERLAREQALAERRQAFVNRKGAQSSAAAKQSVSKADIGLENDTEADRLARREAFLNMAYTQAPISREYFRNQAVKRANERREQALQEYYAARTANRDAKRGAGVASWRSGTNTVVDLDENGNRVYSKVVNDNPIVRDINARRGVSTAPRTGRPRNAEEYMSALGRYDDEGNALNSRIAETQNRLNTLDYGSAEYGQAFEEMRQLLDSQKALAREREAYINTSKAVERPELTDEQRKMQYASNDSAIRRYEEDVRKGEERLAQMEYGSEEYGRLFNQLASDKARADELRSQQNALRNELRYDGLREDVKAKADEYARLNDEYAQLADIRAGGEAGFYSKDISEKAAELGALEKEIKEAAGLSDEEFGWVIDSATRAYNAKAAAELETDMRKFAAEHPVLANIASVVTSKGALKDVPKVLEAVIKDLPVDTNAMQMTNITSAIRDETAQRIGNGALQFLYQTGMSMADFLTMVPLDAVSGSGALSLALMGTTAGASAVKEATERGMSSRAAFATGIAAGVFEALFEKVSLENLLEPGRAKSVLEYLLKNAVAEGSEEVATDLANMISDRVMNGGLSEFEQNVQRYISEGYSEDAARKAAYVDFAKNLAMSGLGGALSGLLMAGGNAMSTNTRTTIAANAAGVDLDTLGRAGQLELAKSYERGVNRAEYTREFYQAYNRGTNGEGFQYSEGGALTEAQARAAYYAGEVDANPEMVYNKLDERSVQNGREGTEGNQGLRGASQEGVPGRSVTAADSAVAQRRVITSENVRDSRVLLSDSAKTALKERGIEPIQLDETDDAENFSKALNEARSADRVNGWAVSPQSPEQLQGARLYMAPDGSAGFAIRNGDIEAVFSNKGKGAPKKTLASMMPQMIAAGGTKLDCYGPELAQMYAAFGGFVPVNQITFNAEFANDGYNPEINGEPNVITMMLPSTETDIDSIIARQSTNAIPSLADLQALPLIEQFDKDGTDISYDVATAKRDKAMERARKNYDKGARNGEQRTSTSNRGERNGRVDSDRPASEVESRTGQAESEGQGNRAGSLKARRTAYIAEHAGPVTSTNALKIQGGTDTKTFRRVSRDLIKSMPADMRADLDYVIKHFKAVKGRLGFKSLTFVDGNLEVIENGEVVSAPAFVTEDGDVYINVSAKKDITRIFTHEEGHKLWKLNNRGGRNIKMFKRLCKENGGLELLNRTIDAYASAYYGLEGEVEPGSSLYNYLLQEVFCDARAGLNPKTNKFGKAAQLLEATFTNGVVNSTAPTTANTQQTTAENETRGSPTREAESERVPIGTPGAKPVLEARKGDKYFISQDSSDMIDILSEGVRVDVEAIMELPEIAQTEAEAAQQTPTIELPNREGVINGGVKDAEERGSYNPRTKAYDGPVKTGRDRSDMRVDIVIGLPGSGKSSAYTEELSSTYQSRVIDTDDYRESIPEYNKRNAGVVHEEASKIKDAVLERAVMRGDNLLVSQIGDNAEKLKKKIANYNKAGYSVYLHLNELPNMKAIGRTLDRFLKPEGRYVSPRVTSAYGDKPTQVFIDIVKEATSGQGLQSNSGEELSGLREGGRARRTARRRNVGASASEPQFVLAGWDAKSNDVEYGQRPKEIDLSRWGLPQAPDGGTRFYRDVDLDAGEQSNFAPVFYSQLNRIAETMKGDKLGASSIIPFLKGKGVKDEEIKWSGLAQFLEGKKSVPKQELLDFLKENELQIEEKMLTEEGNDPKYFFDSDYDRAQPFDSIEDAIDELYNWEWNSEDQDEEPFTIQPSYYEENAWDVFDNETGDIVDSIHMNTPEGDGMTHWERYTAGNEYLDGNKNYREYMFVIPSSDYENRAMSTHWRGQRGVLVHTRVEDIPVITGAGDIKYAAFKRSYQNALDNPPAAFDAYLEALQRQYQKKFSFTPELDTIREVTIENIEAGAQAPFDPDAILRMESEQVDELVEWNNDVQKKARRVKQARTTAPALFIDEIQSDWHNAAEEKIDPVTKKKRGYRSDIKDPEIARLQNEADALRQEWLNSSPTSYDFGNRSQDVYARFNEVQHRLQERVLQNALEERGWTIRPTKMETETEAMDMLEVVDADGKPQTINDARYFWDEDNVFSAMSQDSLLEGIADAVPDAPFRNGKYIEYALKSMLRKAAEGGYDYLAWTTGKMQEDRWSSEYAEGYRIEYDQDIPNFLKKYGKQWGAKLTEVEIADGVMAPAIEITPEMKESVLYKGQPRFYRDVDEYFEQGENPVRDIRIAQTNIHGEPIGKATRTIAESSLVNDQQAKEDIKDVAATTSRFTYELSSNPEAIAEATDRFNGIMEEADGDREKGLERARGVWDGMMASNSLLAPADIAFGGLILKTYAEMGNDEGLIDMTADLEHYGARFGQGVQAFRILKKLGEYSPRLAASARLKALKKAMKQINADLASRYGRKAPKIDFTEAMGTRLLQASTVEEQEQVADEIMQHLADQLPQDWVDKWNAWRYLAMLGNPRTHIRNMVGNGVFTVAVAGKNKISGALEDAILGNEKSRAFLERHGVDTTRTKTAKFIRPEYLEAGRAIVADHMDELRGQGKYTEKDAIYAKRKIWKDSGIGHVLNEVNEKNGNWLENEDRWFLEKYFTRAYARYLQANDVSLVKLEDEKLDKINEQKKVRAVQYAVKEAQKATYRDMTAFSQALNKLSKSSKAGALIVESLMPFKGTPVNIFRRGVEYSPIGLVTSIGKAITEYRKGTMSVSELIDGFSAGLTGTALLLLGVLLRDLGWVKAGQPDDDAEALLGEQAYSVNIFGVNATLDWMAPGSMPFFVGAQIMDMREKNHESGWETIEALAGLGEPMLEMSFLQGISDVIESAGRTASYADDANVKTAVAKSVGWTMVTNYLSQAIPTLAGQIARSADPYGRTYLTTKTEDIPTDIQYFLQKTAGKIPFLENSLQPRLDAWGNEDKATGPAHMLARALENLFSPAYINITKEDEVTEEIIRINEALGNNSATPKKAPTYFTIDGEKIYLNREDITTYRRAVGEISYSVLQRLFKIADYDNLSPGAKQAAVGEVYAYAKKQAQSYVDIHKDDDIPAQPVPLKESDYRDAAERALNSAVVAGQKDLLETAINERDAKGAVAAVKEQIKRGVPEKTIKGDITRAYKSLYLELKESDPSAAKSLRDVLISAYIAAGYTQKDASKKVDEWKATD